MSKYNELIEGLNQIRCENKYSINTLAQESGMPYSATYKIMHNQRIPQIDTIEKLLNVMGYTLSIVPQKVHNNKS